MKKWVITIIIWMILIISLILSVRSSTVATMIMKNTQDVATISQINEQQIVMSFASAYVSEFATLDKDEPLENRVNRLKLFNKNLIESYRLQDITGSYKPSSVSVLSCVKNKDSYFVTVLVNSLNSEPLCFKCRIGLSNGNPYSASIPVLVPFELASEKRDSNYSYGVSDELKVFAERFLESYLQGENKADISIYTVQDSELKPVGNSKLVSVTGVTSESKVEQPKKVQAQYWVDVQGAVIKQHAIIEVQWENNKPLVVSINPI
ncbi:hypothetical protein V6C27_13760 [Peptococcaceae bacterium 1198_IL3148]